MKRINKLTISIMLIFFMIFSYVAPIAPVFAAGVIKYERDSHGNRLDAIATKVQKDLTTGEVTTYVDKKYSAYSVRITNPKVIVYNYYENGETPVEKMCTGNDTSFSFVENRDKCFLKTNQNYNEVYYTIELPEGNGTYNNIASVLYLDAVRYDGVSYDIKLNIKEIRKEGDAKSDFRILKGKKETGSEADKFILSTYTADFNPSIAVGKADGVKTEVDVEYEILDKTGKLADGISGIFGATDIDLNQGVFIKDYNVSRSNTYMLDEFDDVLYKNFSNGTFIYTLTEGETENHNAYLLMDDIKKVNLTATYDSVGAVLGLTFINNVHTINYYNKLLVTSEIDHGTTKINGPLDTESSDSISKNTTKRQEPETNKVNFKPAEGYKISSITVDDEPKTIDNCTESNGVYTYTFTDTDFSENIVHHVIVTTELKPAHVLAKYIVVNDEGTQIKELLNIPYQGKVGDQYATTQLTFDGYEFKEVTPANKVSGTMTEKDIVVTYKYVLKDAKVIVKYINADDGTPLAENEVTNGKPGDPYTTSPKTFDNFRLIRTPDNATGNRTVQDIEVVYYYTVKDATVTINYLDEDRKPIHTPDVKTGKVDDDYTSEKKEIKGYEYKTVEGDPSGKMTVNPITVNYIYKLKPAQVVVKYVDTDGKEIHDGKTIDGKYHTSYVTQSEEIDNYKLIVVPDNAAGTMEKDVTTVTYVYDLKEGNVVVNYLDEDGKKIADSETKKGKVTEEYTTEQKNIDGYTIKTKPDNATGYITEEQTVVTYIYSKNAPTEPESQNEQKKTEDQTTYKGNGTVKELPNTGKYTAIIITSTILVIALYGIIMAIKTKKYKDIK